MVGAHDRDWGFFQWSAAGFLVVIGFLSFGLPFLLAGVFLSAWLWRRGPVWPADLGLLAGAGAVCLLIAAINAIGGGLSPTVWAAVGFALTGSASATFWWLRCRPGLRRAARTS